MTYTKSIHTAAALDPVLRVVSDPSGRAGLATDAITENETICSLDSEPVGETAFAGFVGEAGGPGTVGMILAQESPFDATGLAFVDHPTHGVAIDDHDNTSIDCMDMLERDSQCIHSVNLIGNDIRTIGQRYHHWTSKNQMHSVVISAYSPRTLLNCGVTEYDYNGKRLKARESKMTRYKLEFYEKNARRPYRVEFGELTNGYHPKFTNSKEAFDFRLNKTPGRVKIRYASNGGLAAETYTATDGTGRIRWKN